MGLKSITLFMTTLTPTDNWCCNVDKILIENDEKYGVTLIGFCVNMSQRV
jgi:hypothetical protein